jgi:hypothetical protein
MADRSAWEDWITRDRAEIARLSAEIAAAEARIDSIVYGLFNLTPGEIALPESLGSSFKSNTRSLRGIGCCDGQTKQAPQQRGTWRDLGRA